MGAAVSLPSNILLPGTGSYENPDQLVRRKFVLDWELGGVAVGDASQGLQVQIWKGFLDENDNFVLEPQSQGPRTVFFNIPGARELSFSFDQNMNPALAWMAAGVLYYRWYDISINDYTTSIFNGRSPFVALDDKRSIATTSNFNDVLLFYIRGPSLYYRLQRERYATERLLRTFRGPRLHIRRCGMNRGYRMQFEIVGSDAKLI